MYLATCRSPAADCIRLSVCIPDQELCQYSSEFSKSTPLMGTYTAGLRLDYPTLSHRRPGPGRRSPTFHQ
ncbi:hypothetical protein TcWFU_000533 [Taenia crassiceps]|uniref:Uncharacterized protein n=1 Tax=Taenia crassiceps TaxID=6207 RepID=A0ABR4QQ41_9CEST